LIQGSICFYFFPPQVEFLIFLNVFDLISYVFDGPGPEKDRHPFLLNLVLSYQLISLFFMSLSLRLVSVLLRTIV